MELETTVSLKKSKKASKKRAASDPDRSTSRDVVEIGKVFYLIGQSSLVLSLERAPFFFNRGKSKF